MMKSHPEFLGMMNIIGRKDHNLMNSGGLKAESGDESLKVESSEAWGPGTLHGF